MRIQEDFDDGVADGWSSGPGWTIVRHNGSFVYRQTSTNGGSSTLLGESDWTNQSIHADVRPLAFGSLPAWAGLLARYNDEQNYYAVRLRSDNKVEIIRQLDGVTKVLGSRDASVLTNVNNRVRFEAIGTWIRVYINGLRALQVRDGAHRRGVLGSAHDSGARAVRQRTRRRQSGIGSSVRELREWRAFELGFLRLGRERANRFLYGENQVLQIGPNYQEAISGVSYIFGPPEIFDQIIESRIRVLSFAPGDEGFGFFARHFEGGVSVRIHEDGTISLRKRHFQGGDVLDRAAFAATPGKWFRLRLEAVGTRYSVYVDGQPILSGVDPNMDRL